METIDQFIRDNSIWLSIISESYIDEMEWQEEMKDRPGDYFNDTRYFVSEKFTELGIENHDLLEEVKSYIERTVINRLKKN